MPQFLKNKQLHYFYLTASFMTFAESLIEIFVPIYLFQLGYPIYKIVLFYALVSLTFILFSYPGAKLVAKLGITKSIVLSTPCLILFYLGLQLIPTYPKIVWLLPIVLSGTMILYNYAYHLTYLTCSDQKRRGREISTILSLSIIISTFGPFIGGVVSFYWGFTWLYALGSAFLIVGTIPLLFINNKPISMNFSLQELCKDIFSKKERGSLLSFASYAIEASIGRTIWPIFLLLTLITVIKTGLIVSLSAGLSLAALQLIGRLTDSQNKIKLLRWGTLLYALGWFGRIFANTPFKVLAIDTYKNTAEKIIQVPWQAQSYHLADLRGYYKFVVSREIIFNLSRVILLPIIILIFYFDFHPFLLSFGLAALFSAGYLFLEEK